MVEIKELISKVFMLSPQTKKELEEAFPSMDESTQKDLIEYLNEIIAKQDEMLIYIIKNNPDFISELKAFNAKNDRKNIQEIEKKFTAKEEMDLIALEKELSKL